MNARLSCPSGRDVQIIFQHRFGDMLYVMLNEGSLNVVYIPLMCLRLAENKKWT